MTPGTAVHRAPHDCPVCSAELTLTRLSCGSCGTELSGAFVQCDFCALDDADRDLLRVFLSARGNTKEVERHLGVSYPTARARIDGLLDRLGLLPRPAEPASRLEVLEALARGDLDPDEAGRLLADAV